MTKKHVLKFALGRFDLRSFKFCFFVLQTVYLCTWIMDAHYVNLTSPSGLMSLRNLMSCVSALFRNLHWLPIYHRINFMIATVTFRVL